MSCSALQTSNLPISHPIKASMTSPGVSLDFRKASALNALYLLEICKASSGSLEIQDLGGEMPMLLWGLRCLPWYHDEMHRSEYILISFVVVL